MPLLLPALTSSPGLPGAGANTEIQFGNVVAQVWATAIQSYAAAIAPPSTTVAVAAVQLQSQLTPLFSTNHDQTTIQVFAQSVDAAHLAFATTVGLGMAAAGFASIPPPVPLNFASLYAVSERPTGAVAAVDIATLIDLWMRTGIATNLITGVPLPWT